MTKVHLFPDAAAPPEHLGEAGRRLFSGIAAEFAITDTAGLALLTIAATAADRLGAAQAAISRDGEFVVTGEGAKPHPGLHLERVASERLMASLKALRLDLIPAQRPGRPSVPTSVTWRG